MPFTSGSFRFYESDEIDGTATGTHLLSTTVTEESFTRTFHPIGAVVVMTDVDNQLTPAELSIGTEASDYNDIVNAQLVGTALGRLKLFNLAGDLHTIPEGTDIKVKVNVAAIAVPLQTVTCSFKCVVFGYDRISS